MYAIKGGKGEIINCSFIRICAIQGLLYQQQSRVLQLQMWVGVCIVKGLKEGKKDGLQLNSNFVQFFLKFYD